MNFFGSAGEVHLLEERVVLRQLRGTPVLLLEDSSVVALFGGAICCVSAVLRDLVDEEEREDLDALGA